MKTLLLLTALFISFSCFSQDNDIFIGDGYFNPKTKTVSFKIWATIEINRHTFLNDTCKNPIMFNMGQRVAIPIEDEITDSLHTVRYAPDQCGLKGCRIVHLQRIKTDWNAIIDEAIKRINSK